MFGFVRKKPTLASFDAVLTREQIIQTARLVLIDDEVPLILDELRQVGFAVDHDRTGNDLHNIDSQLYDVAIIDYYGVGVRLSPNQGLALMKHVKRVSPRTRRIAYTSKSLTSSESDFFTDSHVVLPKDLGLAESLAIIEEQVRTSKSNAHVFEALLTKLSIQDDERRKEVEDALVASLQKKDKGKFKDYVTKLVGIAAEKTVEKLIDMMF
jgi:hypothetical protein